MEDNLGVDVYNPGAIKIFYGYTTPNSSDHVGLIKVGDATLHGYANLAEAIADCQSFPSTHLYTSKAVEQAAHSRIQSYTTTAGVKYNLEFAYLAVMPLERANEIAIAKGDKPTAANKENAGYKTVRDYTLHDVMQRNGAKKVEVFKGSKAQEWFRLTADQVRGYLCYMQTGNRGYLDAAASNVQAPASITLRPEQREAVNFTKTRFTNSATVENSQHVLWSAIMRFGKTLTALQLIKERKDLKKVLILTHRPQVLTGWYQDFNQILASEGFVFGSQKLGEDLTQLTSRDKSVYFCSLQDARGSFEKEVDTTDATLALDSDEAERMASNLFSKNQIMFDQEYDLIIVDESHEGTLTELAEKVKDNLKSRFWLHLSGTPFNIVDNFDDDMIYEWNYLMERKAKLNYDYDHPGELNPYADLPELCLFSYDLSNVFGKNEYVEITPQGTSFNFAKFFETRRATPDSEPEFVRPKEVNNLLNLITKDRMYEDDERHFPFENVQMKKQLAHTFWLLPKVDSCTALAKMLANHSYFHDFKVVNVAGNNFKGNDALNVVQNAIADNEYTITLSVGRLTTGVTVPEWSAVFLLSNLRAPNLYMQSIFRCKSSGTLPNGEIKTKGYVFDFDPDRTLEMVARISAKTMDKNLRRQLLNSSDVGDDDDLQNNLQECLEYMPVYRPVISSENGRFEQYDTVGLMRQIYNDLGKEVSNCGFEHPALINISSLKQALKDEQSVELLNQLRLSVGTLAGSSKTRRVEVSKSGMSETASKLAKKPAVDVPPEEYEEWKKAKKEEAEEKRAVNNLVKVVQALSVRIPLLMFAQPLENFSQFGYETQKQTANMAVEASLSSSTAMQTVSASTGTSEGLNGVTGASVASGNMPNGWWVVGKAALRRAVTMCVKPSSNTSHTVDDKHINIHTLTRFVDDASWEEFMPKNVTKQLWDEKFKHFFNPIVFEVSCWQVAKHVQDALSRPPLQRPPYIARVFSTFKNPDKETVLTPWKTVNIQMSETFGGLRWVDFDGKYYASDGNTYTFDEIDTNDDLEFKAVWVDQGFDDFWSSKDTTITDLNSKTALYPLYAATSLYYKMVEDGALRFLSEEDLWRRIVHNQIFVNCRVGYSARIAERVLGGYDSEVKPRTSVVDILQVKQFFDRMKLKDEQVEALWHSLLCPANFELFEERVALIMAMDKATLVAFAEQLAEVDVDKFTAVVSNPPYQINTSTESRNSGAGISIWQDFVNVSSYISNYASFVNPGRWQKGGSGTGLEGVRDYFFNSGHLVKFVNYMDKDLFVGVGIGDMTIELLDFKNKYEHIIRGVKDQKTGSMVFDNYKQNNSLDIVLNSADAKIVVKLLNSTVKNSVEHTLWVGGVGNLTKKRSSIHSKSISEDHQIKSARLHRDTDYFIEKDECKKDVDYIKIYYSPKPMIIATRYLPKNELQDTSNNKDRLVIWKSLIPKTGANTLYRNLGPIGEPNSLCTHTWLCRSFDTRNEAENFNTYVQTYLYRYLVSIRKTSLNAYANVHRWVPDLVDTVNPRTGKKGYESDWIDDDLRVVFKEILTDDDWRYIKAEAIAADNGKGDYENGFALPEPRNWDETHPGETWNGKHISLSV